MPAGATYEPIATATGTGSSGSITFSSIPNTYTDLRLIASGTTTTSSVLRMTYNSNNSAVYSQTYLFGNGSTAGSYRETDTIYHYLHSQLGTSTTIPQMFIIDIFSYAGSTNKTTLIQTAMDRNGSGAVEREVGLFRSTSAITTILFATGNGSFSTDFKATLYGIKAA